MKFPLSGCASPIFTCQTLAKTGLHLDAKPNVVWEPSHEMMDQAQSLIEWQPDTYCGASLSDFRAELFAAWGNRMLCASTHQHPKPGRIPARPSITNDNPLYEDIRKSIGRRIGLINTDMLLRRTCSHYNLIPQSIRQRHLGNVFNTLEPLLRIYLHGGELHKLMHELRSLDQSVIKPMNNRSAKLPAPADLRRQIGRPTIFDIVDEGNIVKARDVAKNRACEYGLSSVQSVKVATVVSELGRNILIHAKSGEIKIQPLQKPEAGIKITAKDRGPGIPHIDEVLSGHWRSKTGMGMGIIGCKRLMTTFEVQTIEGIGTTITTTMSV